MSARTSGVESRATELRSGAAVEVAYFHPLGGAIRMTEGTKTVRGRLHGFAGGELYVEVGGDLRRFAEEKVRYLSPVDEMLHAASFRPGDRVRITKYGGRYLGSVADVFKTRLDVVFTTRGGKVKRQRIPAIDCERVS